MLSKVDRKMADWVNRTLLKWRDGLGLYEYLSGAVENIMNNDSEMIYVVFFEGDYCVFMYYEPNENLTCQF